jgi:alginate O-acetyltransferase complex protein AlgI
MSFYSFYFLLLFFFLLCLFSLCRNKWVKLAFLLFGNLVFYYLNGGLWALVFLVVFIGGIYGLGFFLATHPKRVLFVLSLVLSLLPLVAYKYVSTIFGYFLPGNGYSTFINQITIPLGLSFVTLNAIAYLSEIYTGKMSNERNLLIFSIYLSLFSYIVSGPIEDPKTMIQDLNENHPFDYENVAIGLRRMGLGLFLKVFIADSLGYIVNSVFGGLSTSSALMIVFASIAFTFEIYADFYGYSLIAQGSAQALGLSLSDNFHQPYLSSSLSLFWRRWHMTFQNWLMNYIYFPLGGSRCPKWRIAINLLIVFLASGLWHGAGFTFIVWGLLNGLYLLIERAFGLNKKAKKGTSRIFGTIVTFLLISLSWVFFRSASLSDALVVFRAIFYGAWKEAFAVLTKSISLLSLLPSNSTSILRMIFGVVGIAFLICLDFSERKKGSLAIRSAGWRPALRWTCYLSLIIISVGIGVWGSVSPFMYAQF